MRWAGNGRRLRHAVFSETSSRAGSLTPSGSVARRTSRSATASNWAVHRVHHDARGERPGAPEISLSLRMKSSVEWLLLAACAGLTLRGAARVAMRVVALQAEVAPAFSGAGPWRWSSSARSSALPSPFSSGHADRGFALRHSPVLRPGSSYSALALWPPPSARSALRGTSGAQSLTVVAFAGVFVVYGVALEVLWRVKRRQTS